jgi:hypothetical protein
LKPSIFLLCGKLGYKIEFHRSLKVSWIINVLFFSLCKMREELQKFVVDEHRMAIEGKSGVWFRAKTTTQP